MWGLKQRNLLVEILQMQNSGIAVQVLPFTNTVCLKIMTRLSKEKRGGREEMNHFEEHQNICKLETMEWDPPGMEILD